MEKKEQTLVNTVLTCEGDLHAEDFPVRLNYLISKLKALICNDDKLFKVNIVEPWNSVRVTFSVPQEAAQRLRQLVETEPHVLRMLGILSVQVEGSQLNALNLPIHYRNMVDQVSEQSQVSCSAQADHSLTSSAVVTSASDLLALTSFDSDIADYIQQQPSSTGKMSLMTSETSVTCQSQILVNAHTMSCTSPCENVLPSTSLQISRNNTNNTLQSSTINSKLNNDRVLASSQSQVFLNAQTFSFSSPCNTILPSTNGLHIPICHVNSINNVNQSSSFPSSSFSVVTTTALATSQSCELVDAWTHLSPPSTSIFSSVSEPPVSRSERNIQCLSWLSRSNVNTLQTTSTACGPSSNHSSIGSYLSTNLQTLTTTTAVEGSKKWQKQNPIVHSSFSCINMDVSEIESRVKNYQNIYNIPVCTFNSTHASLSQCHQNPVCQNSSAFLNSFIDRPCSPKINILCSPSGNSYSTAMTTPRTFQDPRYLNQGIAASSPLLVSLLQNSKANSLMPPPNTVQPLKRKRRQKRNSNVNVGAEVFPQELNSSPTLSLKQKSPVCSRTPETSTVTSYDSDNIHGCVVTPSQFQVQNHSQILTESLHIKGGLNNYAQIENHTCGSFSSVGFRGIIETSNQVSNTHCDVLSSLPHIPSTLTQSGFHNNSQFLKLQSTCDKNTRCHINPCTEKLEAIPNDDKGCKNSVSEKLDSMQPKPDLCKEYLQSIPINKNENNKSDTSITSKNVEKITLVQRVGCRENICSNLDTCGNMQVDILDKDKGQSLKFMEPCNLQEYMLCETSTAVLEDPQRNCDTYSMYKKSDAVSFSSSMSKNIQVLESTGNVNNILSVVNNEKATKEKDIQNIENLTAKTEKTVNKNMHLQLSTSKADGCSFLGQDNYNSCNNFVTKQDCLISRNHNVLCNDAAANVLSYSNCTAKKEVNTFENVEITEIKDSIRRAVLKSHTSLLQSSVLLPKTMHESLLPPQDHWIVSENGGASSRCKQLCDTEKNKKPINFNHHENSPTEKEKNFLGTGGLTSHTDETNSMQTNENICDTFVEDQTDEEDNGASKKLKVSNDATLTMDEKNIIEDTKPHQDDLKLQSNQLSKMTEIEKMDDMEFVKSAEQIQNNSAVKKKPQGYPLKNEEKEVSCLNTIVKHFLVEKEEIGENGLLSSSSPAIEMSAENGQASGSCGTSLSSDPSSLLLSSTFCKKDRDGQGQTMSESLNKGCSETKLKDDKNKALCLDSKPNFNIHQDISDFFFINPSSKNNTFITTETPLNTGHKKQACVTKKVNNCIPVFENSGGEQGVCVLCIKSKTSTPLVGIVSLDRSRYREDDSEMTNTFSVRNTVDFFPGKEQQFVKDPSMPCLISSSGDVLGLIKTSASLFNTEFDASKPANSQKETCKEKFEACCGIGKACYSKPSSESNINKKWQLHNEDGSRLPIMDLRMSNSQDKKKGATYDCHAEMLSDVSYGQEDVHTYSTQNSIIPTEHLLDSVNSTLQYAHNGNTENSDHFVVSSVSSSNSCSPSKGHQGFEKDMYRGSDMTQKVVHAALFQSDINLRAECCDKISTDCNVKKSLTDKLQSTSADQGKSVKVHKERSNCTGEEMHTEQKSALTKVQENVILSDHKTQLAIPNKSLYTALNKFINKEARIPKYDLCVWKNEVICNNTAPVDLSGLPNTVTEYGTNALVKDYSNILSLQDRVAVCDNNVPVIDQNLSCLHDSKTSQSKESCLLNIQGKTTKCDKPYNTSVINWVGLPSSYDSVTICDSSLLLSDKDNFSIMHDKVSNCNDASLNKGGKFSDNQFLNNCHYKTNIVKNLIDTHFTRKIYNSENTSLMKESKEATLLPVLKTTTRDEQLIRKNQSLIFQKMFKESDIGVIQQKLDINNYSHIAITKKGSKTDCVQQHCAQSKQCNSIKESLTNCDCEALDNITSSKLRAIEETNKKGKVNHVDMEKKFSHAQDIDFSQTRNSKRHIRVLNKEQDKFLVSGSRSDYHQNSLQKQSGGETQIVIMEEHYLKDKKDALSFGHKSKKKESFWSYALNKNIPCIKQRTAKFQMPVSGHEKHLQYHRKPVIRSANYKHFLQCSMKKRTFFSFKRKVYLSSPQGRKKCTRKKQNEIICAKADNERKSQGHGTSSAVWKTTDSSKI
ncbi:uncharacterized protein LOC143240524 isoform X2 [Tachypleus tridentatus]